MTNLNAYIMSSFAIDYISSILVYLKVLDYSICTIEIIFRLKKYSNVTNKCMKRY